MRISFPTGDPNIDRLLAELTAIAKEHGPKSEEALAFLEKHSETVFVERSTGFMHTFPELADPYLLLMGGITNPDPEEPDPADWWKQ